MFVICGYDERYLGHGRRNDLMSASSPKSPGIHSLKHLEVFVPSVCVAYDERGQAGCCTRG